MKKKILEIIRDILKEKGQDISIEITEDSKLRDLGLTSYDLAALTVNIEDEFDVDIFEDGLVETVGEIFHILESKKR